MHQFPAVLTDFAAMVVAEAAAIRLLREDIGSFKYKAVYTKHVDKRKRYRRTDRRTNATDGWTDRPFYRGALEHLKSVSETKAPREVRFVASCISSFSYQDITAIFLL